MNALFFYYVVDIISSDIPERHPSSDLCDFVQIDIAKEYTLFFIKLTLDNSKRIDDT